MAPQVITVDQRIARIARRSRGVVTHDELLAAGVTRNEIKTRRKRGSLIDVYRGVYRVGHAAPSWESDYVAAVKACGEGAAISGRAAAHVHGLIRSNPAPPPEVTAPNPHRLPGDAVVRRSKTIEATTIRGIRTTTVPRTLIDLAAILGEDDLAKAVHEATVRYRTKPQHVEAILRPNARGAGKLRAVLRGDTRILLSHLERAFVELLKKHDLPLPDTNKRIANLYIDCRWPALRVTVELDSYRYHTTRHQWEQDRKRGREARARGDAFRQYCWGEITGEPEAVLADLRPLLNAATLPNPVWAA